MNTFKTIAANRSVKYGTSPYFTDRVRYSVFLNIKSVFSLFGLNTVIFVSFGNHAGDFRCILTSLY